MAKPNGKNKKFATQLPPEQIKWLKVTAAKQGTKIQWLVSRLIQQAMDRKEKTAWAER